MQTEPTPYSILPPPDISYAPTIWVWLLTLIIGLVLVILIKLLFKLANSKRKLQLDPVAEVQQAVQHYLSTQSITKDELNALILKLKRLLSAITKQDLTSSTRANLTTLTTQLNSTVLETLKIIFELDELTYQPNFSYLEALSLIGKTQEKLSSLNILNASHL